MQNSFILFATIQTFLFVAFAFNYIKLIHSLIKKH